jgi:hypothetical protein
MPRTQASGQWESVTPTKAEKWLNEHNTNNRKLRPGVAEKYADDMRAGKWLPNPQPIMFFEDGSLADGQHRLWAIVESGKTLSMYVVRDVSREAALNIDTGLGRGLSDNARIAGEGAISHRIIAMAKFVEYGTHSIGRALSNSQRMALIEKHRPHLEWVDQHLPQRRTITNAVVGAAIARAHMHERDLDRLSEFCEVLASGMPESQDDAACIAIRNFLIEGAGRATKESHDTFLKTMNAIKYFMRRRPLTVIKGVKEEVYPLPEKPAKLRRAA